MSIITPKVMPEPTETLPQVWAQLWAVPEYITGGTPEDLREGILSAGPAIVAINTLDTAAARIAEAIPAAHQTRATIARDLHAALDAKILPSQKTVAKAWGVTPGQVSKIRNFGRAAIHTDDPRILADIWRALTGTLTRPDGSPVTLSDEVLLPGQGKLGLAGALEHAAGPGDVRKIVSAVRVVATRAAIGKGQEEEGPAVSVPASDGEGTAASVPAVDGTISVTVAPTGSTDTTATTATTDTPTVDAADEPDAAAQATTAWATMVRDVHAGAQKGHPALLTPQDREAIIRALMDTARIVRQSGPLPDTDQPF